jgi:hypothetical protein
MLVQTYANFLSSEADYDGPDRSLAQSLSLKFESKDEISLVEAGNGSVGRSGPLHRLRRPRQ